jgi:hypothetical protein
VELEQRLSRVEGCCEELTASVANGGTNECQDSKNYVTLASPTEPSLNGLVTGSGKSPVDPNLQP